MDTDFIDDHIITSESNVGEVKEACRTIGLSFVGGPIVLLASTQL